MVKEISLNEIVKRLHIRNACLKMDIEGGEYSAFRDATKETLRAFKKMHIETHYGYKDIAEKLKSCGFKVRIEKIEYRWDGMFGKTLLAADIYAWR